LNRCSWVLRFHPIMTNTSRSSPKVLACSLELWKGYFQIRAHIFHHEFSPSTFLLQRGAFCGTSQLEWRFQSAGAVALRGSFGFKT
jgi:hypothetical protein